MNNCCTDRTLLADGPATPAGRTRLGIATAAGLDRLASTLEQVGGALRTTSVENGPTPPRPLRYEDFQARGDTRAELLGGQIFPRHP